MFEKLRSRCAMIGAGVVGLFAAGTGSATSVLTAGMTTALGDGFTDLQDTVADVISVAWPYVLAILALYAAPGVVKKLWNMAAR